MSEQLDQLLARDPHVLEQPVEGTRLQTPIMHGDDDSPAVNLAIENRVAALLSVEDEPSAASHAGAVSGPHRRQGTHTPTGTEHTRNSSCGMGSLCASRLSR